MKSKKLFASAILLTLAAAMYVAAASSRHIVPGTATTAPAAAQESDGAKYEMTAVELKHRLDKNEKTTILDARGTVNGQTIKGALHVPTSEVEAWSKNVSKAAFIVSFCTCPHDEAANASVAKLRGLGFKNAFSLKGGLNAAMQAGIPTADVSE
jgi:rhodanese-related sulfurtransferase